ncbi:hypothetical protein [Nocardia sp. NPDC004722]
MAAALGIPLANKIRLLDDALRIANAIMLASRVQACGYISVDPDAEFCPLPVKLGHCH